MGVRSFEAQPAAPVVVDLTMATDINTIANIATAGTLLVALAFGVAQVRMDAQRRKDTAALSMLTSWQDPALADALRCVLSLPDAADPALIEADPEKERAAEQIDYIMESWGIGVFERIIDLHTVDRGCGGIVRSSWRKLGPYVASRRVKYGDPNWGEWFQWLVERMEEDPVPGKAAGAHVTHARWRR